MRNYLDGAETITAAQIDALCEILGAEFAEITSTRDSVVAAIIAAGRLIDHLPEEERDEAMARIEAVFFQEAAQPAHEDTANQETNAAISVIHAIDSQLMARSKLFREQDQIAAKQTPGQLDVGGKGRKAAQITAQITTTDGKPLPITAFDREVQNVIGTLVKENGPGVYTPEQIFRELAGLPNDAKVTPSSTNEITEAVLKMTKIHCKVDMTAQMENHLGRMGTARFQGALVVADVCTAEYNGKEAKTAFKIYRAPTLFAYSESISQVARIKRILLDTTLNKNTANLPGAQKTRNNSRTFVLLKRYIAQEISTMRGKSGRSNRMRFETMAHNIDVPEPTRKQLRTIRDDATYYLGLLQSMGEIKGFSEYKEGRAIVGVEVSL